MNENDIKIVKSPGPVRQYKTEDLTNSDESTVLYPGEPVKRTDGSTDYVERLETGDPEIGTDVFVGIVAKTSTETSANDGVVNVYTLLPNLTVLRCLAHTSGNIDTASELLAFLHNSVTFDLTSTVFSIDEDETDDPNVHGLRIIDGDINKYTLDVLVHSMVTESGAYL